MIELIVYIVSSRGSGSGGGGGGGSGPAGRRQW